MNEEVRTISLGRGHYALVDAIDLPLLKKYKWYFAGEFARRLS